jgi:monothiol glutaredoxin
VSRNPKTTVNNGFFRPAQLALTQFSVNSHSVESAFMSTVEVIKSQISENPVILYMKGTPQFPQCGFSARAVEVLSDIGEAFAFVNILENPEIRAELPKYAQWPTFPQLWVDGELVGGSDILLEMHQGGELAPMIKAATQQSAQQTTQQPAE